MGDLCDNHALSYDGCAALCYECLSGECVPVAHFCDHQSHCADTLINSYKLSDIMSPITSKKVTLHVKCLLSFAYQIKDKS